MYSEYIARINEKVEQFLQRAKNRAEPVAEGREGRRRGATGEFE